jgi:two-component system, OmpR family, response regulator ChvI
VSKISTDDSSTTNTNILNRSQPINSLGVKKEEDEICFIGAQNCCVCFVDIVNSTGITSSINTPEKVRRFYEIFLNTIAAIARESGAKIIKNVGDCLIFYYPGTADPSNKSAFNDVLECCITMVEARETINRKLHEEELPSLSYRISVDYGRVEVARSATSKSDDLFGPIMNMCSKINSKALPNEVVIGDGLYHQLQSFSLLSSLEENHCHFEKMVMPEYQQAEFKDYPLYSLQKNNSISSFSESDAHEQQQSSSVSILLVDDEKDSLYTFKKSLASEGYDVDAFVDPVKALAHFSKLSPSHYKLAVLDIRMPGLNGLQLYYRLKAINRNIKILFISALDAVPELTSILPDLKAAMDIMKKPVELHEFISTIRRALTL